MKHIFFFLVVFNFGLVQLFFTSFANGAKGPEKKYAEKINSILKKHKIDPEDAGLEISLLDQVVYAQNANKKFIPASVSKIVTSFAVLKTFPPNYRFKTELLYDQQNLYLKGGGDPAFVSENMWFLVNEFVRQNIKTIPGDLIVDDSLFDLIRYDASRESVRVDRSYDSPVGAMSFNWNSINIYVKPGDKGEKAQVYLDPESDYFKLVNKTQSNDNKSLKDLIINVDQEGRIITVSGDVHSRAPEKAYYKNVAEPDLWSAENLKSFLKQRGILIKGKIRKGKTPEGVEVVASSESKSLSGLLTDMNKFSNNFVAEMLTKNMAAFAGQKPATLERGIQMIRDETLKAGLAKDSFVIINPSGFSRDNRLTAAGLNRILFAFQKDFKIFPTLIEGLPIAGLDGTLKKRMKGTLAEGYVRGKTGYLDNVVSLAGYAGQKDGEIYHFSFLYNGRQDEATVREAFDQILIYILE